MNLTDYLHKKEMSKKYQKGYAGALCGKCGEGMVGNDSIRFTNEIEAKLKKKYVRVCDNCRKTITI